jgi:O-antigen/teichoic acid export membrane protein
MLDKLKSLSKQTFIYGTSTIIGRFLNFILVPFYTNVFPPADYGVVSVIFAYIAFLNIFYSLGFESGYFKFASTLEVGNEKQNFSIPFFTIFANGFILSSLMYLSSGSIASIVGLQGNNEVIPKYAAVIIFFDAIALVPFAYLRLKNKAKIFAAIKLINISVNIALNFILILVFKFGLVAIFVSNLFASVITFLFLLPFVIKMLSFDFNRQLFSELAKFSLPYLPAGLAAIIVQVIDKPVLQYLTNIANVGIYNANYKLGIFMMLIVSMFEYAWRPFFLNNANEPDAKRLFSNVMTAFLGFSSIVMIILSFFIQDIIKIPLPYHGYLIGAKYWSGVYIVPVILFGYLLYGLYVILMAGIYIEKKTRYLPFITGLAALVNVVGNFIMIPLIGIMGAALATFLSYLSMTLYIYKISQKFYPVEFDVKKIYSMIAVDIIAVCLFYLSYLNIIPSGIYLKITSSLIFTGLIIYISGLSKIKYLFRV